VGKSSGFGLRNLLIFARSRKERGKPLTPDQVDLIEDWEKANGRHFIARDEASSAIWELPVIRAAALSSAQKAKNKARNLQKVYKKAALYSALFLFGMTLGSFWNLVKTIVMAVAKVFVDFTVALLGWIGDLIVSSPIPIAVFIILISIIMIAVFVLEKRAAVKKKIATEAEQQLREMEELKIKELLRL